MVARVNIGTAPLQIVKLVFYAKTRLTNISHVVDTVSLYLDSSVELPLHKACKFNSLNLLNRIFNSTSNNNARCNWSIRVLLQQEPHYRQHEFTKSMLEAVRLQNLDMMKWLCINLPGQIVTSDVVEVAAAMGSFPILQFFLDNDNTGLGGLPPATKPNVGFRVEWGGRILSAAISSHRSDIMWWLKGQLGNIQHDWHHVLSTAIANGDVLMAKWLMRKKNSFWSGRSQRLRTAQEAITHGRLDILKWLDSKHQLNGMTGWVVAAAQCGQLAIVRWLLDNGVGIDGEDFTGLGEEASLAVHIAAVDGHLKVAKYLCARTQTPTTTVECARQREEQFNQLRQLASLDMDEVAAIVSCMTLAIVAGKGNLRVVQWLCDEYGEAQEVNLFVDATGETVSAAMDNAARNGHLEVLQYLHNWQSSVKTSLAKRKREEVTSWPSPICSKAAMNGAAANGHLEVIQWLHCNRSEGCSVLAIDAAAGGGHLEVVKWLIEHRKEGYSTAAMDGAARNGHLEMVQWLNANTDAGCTTKAMDQAATKGHINVVKWLHETRKEGCTAAAMDGAAANGYLDVVKYLHRNRTEGCTAAAMDNAAHGGYLRVVEWLHCQREEGCTSAAIDNAAESGHFEVFLFLHFQCSQKCTIKTIEAASDKDSSQIRAWINANYPAYWVIEED
ncbi:Ankyrin repeats domain-containing protein [Phytophthora infestans]|uniref:Ankyrin repeats domain-containing protein n=1 Tax=Phytophthora infestans TaxID=4787 RepID=A0A8S9UJS5_PHYIN|nr:Ankyrin repeats domain-containing protein [Phytophthora infestans]